MPLHDHVISPMADFGVKTHHPKWEKRLPQKFIIAATEETPTLLKLKVKIETMDTAEKKSVTSLVDCRPTGEFIDQHYAKSNRFNLVKLSQPIPIYNVDGTPNEAGSITEVVNLILQYKNHLKRTTFAISSLGKQKLILGHSWLWKHNPEIDWITREVKMSRCPPRCCLGCRDEVHQQCVAQKVESWQKDTCTAGPIPKIDHNFNHCETRRVVFYNPNGCKVIIPMEKVVFWDCGIYHFFQCEINSTN